MKVNILQEIEIIQDLEEIFVNNLSFPNIDKRDYLIVGLMKFVI